MKNGRWSLLGVCAISFAVLAASLTLYASDSRWSNRSNISGTGISSEFGIRVAGSFVIIRFHNETPNQSKPISLGQEVKIVWQDGSSERVKLKCLSSPACAEPVDGTQQPAPGSSGSGGGPYDDGGGYGPGDGGLGGTPYENCMVDRETGCVAVGESENQCHTFSVLNCPP